MTSPPPSPPLPPSEEIALAASTHNILLLKALLNSDSSLVNFQDPETGYTPLHWAILGCISSDLSKPVEALKAERILGEGIKTEKDQIEELRHNGERTLENGLAGDPTRALEHAAKGTTAATSSDHGLSADSQTALAPPDGISATEGVPAGATEEDLESGRETVKLLLANGAIWNDLDVRDETPGCLAHRLGLSEIYELIVEAGVRAELLLGLLEGYAPLGDKDSEDEEDEDDGGREDVKGEEKDENGEADKFNHAKSSQRDDEEKPIPSNITNPPTTSDPTPETYLTNPLHPSSTPNALLDTSLNPIMMSWETPIMSLSASLLLPRPGLRVLNIGFGLGIIDRCIQSYSPSTHHIIEAHPSVLTSPLLSPFRANPTCTIHAGKWQHVLPLLIDQGLQFDAVYYDTFAESYAEFKIFFEQWLSPLLADGARWAFFHGAGADRRVCYDVYTRVAEMDLGKAGWGVEWHDVPVREEGEEGMGGQEAGRWEGMRRPYWVLDTYRLPLCTALE
ncbi:MAG: Arginine N-methyltransferase 2 [Vezdaea acicularis]|nr:MAG: Arginine N-methyltransferase 2 [Vezdaea acicularis]